MALLHQHPIYGKWGLFWTVIHAKPLLLESKNTNVMVEKRRIGLYLF